MISSSGAGNSRVFELRAPMMVQNDGPADDDDEELVRQKDMDVIGAFAKAIKVPIPMFKATLPVYKAALKGGYGEQDTAAVCAVMEKQARVKRKTGSRKKR